jgi:hypothetical protein
MNPKSTNFDELGAAIFLGFVVLLGLALALRQLRAAQRRPTIRRVLRRFLGRDLERLETHDKHFPGYDLASLSRALGSFRDDCCTVFQDVGAMHVSTMPELLATIQVPSGRRLKATAPTYQRLRVAVDQERSFPTSGIYLAELRPEDGGGKIAILLAAYNPAQPIVISIACRSRAVADRFFSELEERRRRLSVYRGKVIDPVVGPGGIISIGFRAIHQVRENDLILPESVKDLVRRAVLGFCEHADLLRDLGIDLKRGVLVHGSPGTGKTSLSLYLAGRLPEFTVCFVSGDRLLYPREICRMARYLQPAMIVFEDIDLVAQERNANSLATVLGELMNQIDGCEQTDQVLFVMNTNSLERLEHAVKDRPGRVDQIIAIPLPGPAERRQLLGLFARSARIALDDWDKVLAATEGMTPAMLKEIVKRAAVNAIERDGSGVKAGTLAIEEGDLLLAAEQVPALRDPERAPRKVGFGEERR